MAARSCIDRYSHRDRAARPLRGGMERYRSAMQWREETEPKRKRAAKKPTDRKKAVGE